VGGEKKLFKEYILKDLGRGGFYKNRGVEEDKEVISKRYHPHVQGGSKSVDLSNKGLGRDTGPAPPP